jgi:hypothetical protein
VTMIALLTIIGSIYHFMLREPTLYTGNMVCNSVFQQQVFSITVAT